jgi:glycosyltransferase involved in cell wall biosynthesis
VFQGKKIGITVPTYNEEALIAITIGNMPPYADRIYVVNDGSTDGTCRILSGKCLTNDKLVLINHPANRGVGAAIVTGYKRCLEDGMDIAVVMAGDNQMDPAELPRLLEPIVRGEAGYSKGNRMSCSGHLKGMPLWRQFGNRLLRWLTGISSGNSRIMDPQNGYTAASAEALRSIELDSVYPRYGYCNDLLVKFMVAEVRIAEVSMPARYRGEKSKIRYREYVPRVTWLLLSSFVWRMKMALSSSGHRTRAGDPSDLATRHQSPARAKPYLRGISDGRQ